MKTRRNTPLLAILFVAVSAAVIGQNNKPRESAEPKDKLHDAAKKAGGRLVLRYSPSRGRTFADLGELGRHSDAVVIGRTLGHRPHLTPSGNMITNDFLVKVMEVIKGDMPNGRSITVKVPGGAYKFADGTRVAVVASGYTEPQDGVIYAFFLKSRPNKGEYKLVSESQGLFALKPEGIEPADLDSRHSVVASYRGLTPVEFLRQLHRAVPLQKRPTPPQKPTR